MTPARIAALLLLASLSCFAEPVSTGSEAGAQSLVTYQAGDLPVILSAPHGGRENVPGVPAREGKGVRGFQPKTDTNTDRLAEGVADAIARKTGKRPYVVIARFHRKFIDVNREPGSAYESDQAKPVYDAYHEALAATRRDVLDRWGGGVLLDIHGQATGPETIFRGTQNGKTTAHLIRTFGEEAQIGLKSLTGRLAMQGFKVEPPTDSHDKEDQYSGGFIVAAYGSADGGMLDAIQLEFGTLHRASAELPATAEKVADAIIAFAHDFLPKDETAGHGKAARDPAGKIVVGVYFDEGAGPSANDLMRALAAFKNVTAQKLMASDIQSGSLESVNVLIQPGGSGGVQGRHLGEKGRERIRAFVRNGGGYIGICAGAYLASADYAWSLNILDAKVIDREHWARGKGTVEIQLSRTGKQLLNVQSDALKIHYAQGPLLAPGGNPQLTDYEPIATFKTEIALNGAPKGVMIGTTAIASGGFGSGRVVCFSPHPELTAGLESLLLDAIKHVARRQGDQ